MRVGPSEPAYRSRFQTTFGGCSQKLLWIPQIPSVTNAIEISDMRKGTGGWVKKVTGK